VAFRKYLKGPKAKAPGVGPAPSGESSTYTATRRLFH